MQSQRSGESTHSITGKIHTYNILSIRTRKQPAKRKAQASDEEADEGGDGEEKKKPKQPRKRAAKVAAKTVMRYDDLFLSFFLVPMCI